MIITSSPLRIALAGGGSDLPAWREQHGSTIVTASIDLRVYVMVNRRYDGKIRVAYMETEFVDKPEEIKHDIIREVLISKGVPAGGIEIVTVADAPARSGLGSSGAFTVALIQALNLLNGKIQSRRGVAEEAFMIEHNLGKKLGKHDQYASAFGGINVLKISKDNVVKVTPVNVSDEFLKGVQDNLFMFDLKKYRDAKDPLESQNNVLRNKKDSIEAMQNIARMGEVLSEIFLEPQRFVRNVDSIGVMLYDHWVNKCRVSKPDPNVQTICDYGVKSGAIGTKLIGAGVNGFILFYVPINKHIIFIETMDKLNFVRVPFKFDFEGLKTECQTSN